MTTDPYEEPDMSATTASFGAKSVFRVPHGPASPESDTDAIDADASLDQLLWTEFG
jgi:hypothetical protein